MATFTYPQNDFDRPRKLLSLLGSFWANTYLGNDLVEDLASTTAQAAQQSHRQLLELVASVSRFSLPVFHQSNWNLLRIRESKLNTSSSLANKYETGTSSLYSSPSLSSYGDLSSTEYFVYDVPSNLHDVNLILDGIAVSNVQLVKGVDFWHDTTRNLLLFRENPFSLESILKKDILNTDGSVADREIPLWLYKGKYDWDVVYEQFGYALQLKMKSSQGYKDFINAIFDAFSSGTAAASQQQAVAAAFGVPLVRNASEVVETITEDSRCLNIITDKNVYQFPTGTTSLVAVGETVSVGDPLTDLLQVFELNSAKPIEPSDISALVVQPGILAQGYYSGITFENTNVDLVVEENVSGYTKVSWDLGGFPFDIEKFWSDVHSRGVESGETLAMLLDVRESPTGQPTAASLPATINPLQFLADNLLRNNAFIVKVKAGSELGSPLAFIPAAQLRKIQPPHTVMLLIVELVYADSPVIMEAAGTSEEAGYEEAVSGFPCMPIAETMDASSYVAERVRTSQLAGRCV
jgi:hypothetical protein